MRNIVFILLFWAVASCSGDKTNPIPTKSVVPAKDTMKYEAYFDKAYDINDLTKYTDTSKLIARLRYYPAFNPITIVELTEIANGINLCVKQPVEILRIDHPEHWERQKSLPFNQLCYWFADNDARDIKSMFAEYQNGQHLTDLKCPHCFDPSKWRVEIYDHGKYSSITKDYKNRSDSIFVSAILNKVKLSDKKLSMQ